MNTRRFFVPGMVVGLLLLLVGASAAAPPIPPADLPTQAASIPLGNAFTYQGDLWHGTTAVSGLCDFQFALFDASTGGSQIGATQNRLALSVQGGLFVVSDLDFGANAFTGDARWLQVAVRCSPANAWSLLLPRQALNAAPYALFAKNTAWTGLADVPAGFADGVDNDTTYTAGAGLALVGGELSLLLAGSGSAATAAHSDHEHWGATWHGVGAGLTLNGDAPGEMAVLSVVGDDSDAIRGSARDGAGVAGYAHRFGVGVYGWGNQTGGSFAGGGVGVIGHSSAGNGVEGTGALSGGVFEGALIGVSGESEQGIGGQFTGATGVTGSGASGPGVKGISVGGVGAKGESYAGYGVQGESESTYGGYFTGAHGVYGAGLNRNSTGGYFVAGQPNGWAIQTEGPVKITGDLTVTGQVHGFPHPNYDSGWVDIERGASVALTHNLGGNPENYVVDMTFRDLLTGSGIHQINYGGDWRANEDQKGLFWENLTDTSIKVIRWISDVRGQQVRIRIWVYQ